MIIVFGSINVDFITHVPTIPAPGETVLGPSYLIAPGGKGANQALAARLSGADVALVGAVGSDHLAAPALAELRKAGVDLSGVISSTAPTGAAFITIDAEGENAIAVASGANSTVTVDTAHSLTIKAGDTLLCQREIPADAVSAALALARSRGARTLLNAAPATGLTKDTLAAVDILIVNQPEAALIARTLGIETDAPIGLAAAIAAHTGSTVVMTLGGDGVIAADLHRTIAIPAHPIAVIDTTGAGDAFCGAFAAALDTGFDLEAALRRGSIAGALTCTATGAQNGRATRAAIERLLS